MSEHAAAAHAATQPAPAERRRVESDGTWRLVAIFCASFVAVYAVVVGAIYLLVTSVSWQLLLAGGLLVLLFNFLVLFVLVLQIVREARVIAVQRDG